MNTMWIEWRTGNRSHSTKADDSDQAGFRCIVKLAILIFFAVAALSPSLHAQNLNNDAGAPNMSNVTDVTPGWKYLLQNDDLAMVQVTQNSDNSLTTSLTTMNTSKSGLSGTQKTITIANDNSGDVPLGFGILASEASGRMFNINTDTIAVLTESGGRWNLASADSTGVQSS